MTPLFEIIGLQAWTCLLPNYSCKGPCALMSICKILRRSIAAVPDSVTMNVYIFFLFFCYKVHFNVTTLKTEQILEGSKIIASFLN